ncbi:MAG TPA: DUF397 domain-containing protein [Pseudonocardiaceae bacterium]|jgi:hypothetical protein|nr:DUF397 domain-containing protein [Pseudonocardiaceae bacterium]
MDRHGRQSQTYTDWRKSSYSGGTEHGDCVEVAWRKSSYSGATEHGNCVEVAVGEDGVALRDSKNAAGPMLTFAVSDWRTFLASN